MVDKISMKRTYYNNNDSSTQQENQVLSISFIKNLEYWNYLYVHINYMYCLVCIMHSKKLKKLNMIVNNLSEKECERLREMFQRGDLLGGSKGNVYQVFLWFLLKNKFPNINR
jgi:hypothetical protein